MVVLKCFEETGMIGLREKFQLSQLPQSCFSPVTTTNIQQKSFSLNIREIFHMSQTNSQVFFYQI